MTSSSDQQPKFASDETPLTTFYTGLFDVNFEAPLKSVADTLYGISEATELHFLHDDVSENSSNNNSKNKKLKHKLKIVPSKLQTFKEAAFQKTGKKFGFVEFHVRSGEKVEEIEETIKLFNKNLTSTLDHVHNQIDRVLTALSAAPNLGLKLRRLPQPVKEYLESSKVVSSSKDPIKMMAYLATRCQRLPPNAKEAEQNNKSENEKEKENEKDEKNTTTTFFFIDAVPIADLVFLREELPVTFPKTATADSIEKFFVDNLGNAENDCFCLAKKDDGGKE